MQVETLSVTRLTVTLPIRTNLSQGRIRFLLTVERVIDLTHRSTASAPRVTYRLSFRTEHATEALQTHSACDHLGWPTDVFSLSGRAYDLLSTHGADAERDAIRMVLGHLQQDAVEGAFPVQTRRILLALWDGIDTSSATA